METPRTNKLSTTPVSKLLLSLSLPVMISMTFQALYNSIDSMFIAWVSEDALSALSLTYPVQTLMIAVGVGTCIGMSAFLGRVLGQRKFDKATAIVQHGALLAVFSYAIFLVIGLFFTQGYFSAQTSNAEIIAYGIEYMTPCLTFSIFLFGQQYFEKLLQASGKAALSMVAQIVGVLVNLALDPLLIFGLWGLPALGVTGAALATILGQAAAFMLALVFNQRLNKGLKLSFAGFSFKWSFIKGIYQVGLPAIALQAVGSVATFFLNGILLTFSTTAAAMYGAYIKLQSLLFMPIFGLSAGMLPIISFNLGAGAQQRVKDTLRFAMLYAGIIMVLGTIIFQCFPQQLLSLYDASDEMYAIGVPALRIISTYFVFEGFCITCQSGFQALGKGAASLVSSLVRQICVLLPLAFLLSLTGNLEIVWLAFPLTGIIGTGICILLLKKTFASYAPKTEARPGEEA